MGNLIYYWGFFYILQRIFIAGKYYFKQERISVADVDIMNVAEVQNKIYKEISYVSFALWTINTLWIFWGFFQNEYLLFWFVPTLTLIQFYYAVTDIGGDNRKVQIFYLTHILKIITVIFILTIHLKLV